MTLQCVKKRPDEDYREYVVRWKNVASMVRPSLTSREENSMFVDTLPSPYYDMLIVNTFMEFGDLIYSVGRIKDGIKRGRIMDTGASKEERKRFIPMSMFKQCLKRKEDRMRHGKNLSRIILIHHRMPKFPKPIFLHPKSSYENVIETLIQAVIGVIKGKEPRCTTHFQ